MNAYFEREMDMLFSTPLSKTLGNAIYLTFAV